MNVPRSAWWCGAAAVAVLLAMVWWFGRSPAPPPEPGPAEVAGPGPGGGATDEDRPAVRTRGADSLSDNPRVFSSNIAELTAARFFDEHDRWPRDFEEMAEFARAREEESRPAGTFTFDRSSYRDIELEEEDDGRLKLTLVAPDGRREERFARQPPIQAARIIKEQGYLIVEDGSSFYYFAKDGGFGSAPIHLSGRWIEGRWRGAWPGSSHPTGARGWMARINSGGVTQFVELEFILGSAQRDAVPMGPHGLISLGLSSYPASPDIRAWLLNRESLPVEPMVHRAYFAIMHLTPAEPPAAQTDPER